MLIENPESSNEDTNNNRKKNTIYMKFNEQEQKTRRNYW